MSRVKEDVIVVKELLVSKIKGPAATTPVTIGTATTSHSLNSNEDLLVSGVLEVNGRAYFDGIVELNTTTTLIGNSGLAFGSAGAGGSFIKAYSTNQLWLGMGTLIGRNFVIGDAANGLNKNYDHSSSTDPVLWIHSAEDPDTANNQWVSISHDQTDGNIDTGTGTLNLGATGNVNFAGATHTGTGDTATNGYVTLEVAGASIKFATVA